MKRCQTCSARTEAGNGACPVCGNPPDRKAADLTPREKRVRRSVRGILGVAALHLGGFVICLYILLVFNPQAAADGRFVFPPAMLAALAIVNLILAYGLSRCAFWAYRVATAYYFLIGIANIVSVQIPGILLVLALLYLIGNATAKAVFERRAVELSA
jgi:hypothetical protein